MHSSKTSDGVTTRSPSTSRHQPSILRVIQTRIRLLGLAPPHTSDATGSPQVLVIGPPEGNQVGNPQPPSVDDTLGAVSGLS
ncbi:MAG: hypothetical protein QOI06_1677 [Nocardioidaceae bacterium]|jgi:hypothetical protein|nr:hypothetical protein [Nocardioidaceae bacterium]